MQILQLAAAISLAASLSPDSSPEVSFEIQTEKQRDPTCTASAKAPVLLQRLASLGPSRRHPEGLLQLPPAESLGQTGKAAEAWDDAKEGLGVLLFLILVAASSAFFSHRPLEKKEACDIQVSPPQEVAEETAKADTTGGDADFEELLKVAVKAAAQRVGPKLIKAQAVKSILESRVYGFPTKAKSFLVDEIKAAAGTFLTALEAEEVMLMLDLDKSVTAKFPPMTTLLAGILSPTMLSFASSAFMAQLTIVIIPVLALCSWALYQDYGVECSIPTMLLWTKAQLGITLFLGIANGMVALKIMLGKRALDTKTADMQERLAAVKRKSLKEFGAKELRELFVCNSVLIEEALKLEDEVKSSIWHHAVGVGTCAWLLMLVWTFVLVFGWTFVPGVTAFSEDAKGVANYCGAWASVFAARLSTVLALLFLAVNLLTVGHWAVTLLVGSQSFANTVLSQARNFDSNGLGLPLAEVFAKAFLLRGNSDTLRAKLCLAAAEKAELQAERDALQAKLAELDGAFEVSSVAFEAAAAEVADPDAEAKAEKELEKDVQLLEAYGEESLQDAQQKAAEMTQATARELERLLERFTGFAQQLQESEAYQTLASKAKELAETDLQTLAEETAKQAAAAGEALQEAAQAAVQEASSAAEQLQQSETFQQAGQAMESAGRQAKQALQSAEEAVEKSEAMQRAEQALAAAGSQAQQVSEALRSRVEVPQQKSAEK